MCRLTLSNGTKKSENHLICRRPISERENDLQLKLDAVNNQVESFNMTIGAHKIISMTIPKAPLRCKLVINNVTIEQVMITSSVYLEKEVRQEVNKVAVITRFRKQIIMKE